MSNYLDNKELFMKPTVNQYGSHMVMSNVCKETKIKYLNVDTKYCDDLFLNDNNFSNTLTNNQANYNFTLPEKITDVKSIYVDNLQFPSIQGYNISDALGNNCFKYTVSTTKDNPENLVPDSNSFMVIIPDGTYTLLTLIQEINKILKINYNINLKLKSESDTITKLTIIPFYFNQINNNCTYFYTDTTHSINISVDFAVDKNGNFDKYNFKSKLGWLLGFRKPSYIIYNIGASSASEYKNNISTQYTNPIVGMYYQKNSTSEYLPDLNEVNFLPKTDISKFISIKTSNLSVIKYSENYPAFPPSTKYYYLVIDEFSTNFQNSFISTLPYSLINKYIISKININQTNLKVFSNYQNILTVDSYPQLIVNQGLILGDAVYFSANNTNGYLTSSKRNYNGKIDIQKLNVKVIDENGNIVNMQGYDFSFCLKIEHE
jgi:hypothetical protein